MNTLNVKGFNIFEVCSMLHLQHLNDRFIDLIVICNGKWTLYDNRTRSTQTLDYDDQPEHFPKPKLQQPIGDYNECLVLRHCCYPLRLSKM